MIRQAHTYLAGAVSGTALIATAIVAFVALVSLQAVRDWPLAGIGGNDQTGVSAARPAVHAGGTTGEVATGRRPGAVAAGARGGRNPHGGGSKARNTALGALPASSGGPPAGSPPSTEGGATGGGPARSGAPGSGLNGGGGGGGQSGNPSSPGSSPSDSVAGTVNKTVSGVDSATSGALGEAGVTKVTEETVDGVVGPETPMGKTVEKSVETVGGLLGGSGQ